MGKILLICFAFIMFNSSTLSNEKSLAGLKIIVAEYEDNYLTPIMKQKTFHSDEELEEYILNNDSFKKELMEYFEDESDFDRGYRINIKYGNYRLSNLIKLEDDDFFFTLTLRKEIGSEIEELMDGINALGRLRDIYLVKGVINKNTKDLTCISEEMNAYTDLKFNEVKLGNSRFIYTLENHSSLGGHYSCICLKVYEEGHYDKEIISKDIFVSHYGLLEIKLLKFSFQTNSLKLEGKYLENKDFKEYREVIPLP